MKERVISEIPFPLYAYVPKKNKRPENNHLPEIGEDIKTLNSETFSTSKHYLYSIDLFNHGYYWESHEVWERFWSHFGRNTKEAVFFKALIKLAAAGVKFKEGNDKGIKIHLNSALGFLVETRENGMVFGGLDIDSLISVLKSTESFQGSFLIKIISQLA